MFFPIYKFGSRSQRDRKPTPEIVPLSCQPRLKPLSCQSEPQRRQAVIVHGRLEVPLSEASVHPRRISYVEPVAERQLLSEQSAEIVHIYPSRKVGHERTERWVETCELDSDASEDDESYSSRHCRSPPKQELLVDYPRRSRRHSRSPCPTTVRRSTHTAHSSARSASSSSRGELANIRSPPIARSASFSRPAPSARTASTVRSTSNTRSAATTPSLQYSESASTGSSPATSPSLARAKSSRRSSLSTSPR